jgi:U3 small nucleolar RNA-associated protein 3
MQESDYFEDFGDDGMDADGDDDMDADGGSGGGGAPLPRKKDKLAGDLEDLALGLGLGGGAAHVEQLGRDVSRLSDSQRLALLKTQSPELLAMVAELRERVRELREDVAPLRALASLAAAEGDDDDGAQADLVDYLEAKEQLLLTYATNVMFYLHMKASGASVRAHPVMRQLLELRYAIERMQHLDKKMKPFVEALRRRGQGSGSAAPAARRGKHDVPAVQAASKRRRKEEEEEEEEDDEEE